MRSNLIPKALTVNFQATKQLCDLITANALIIGHDIRSPLATISMINEFYREFNNKYLTNSRVGNNELFDPNDINMLRESIDSIEQCVTYINQIADNSLKNIDNAIKLNEGMINEINLVECRIQDNLHINKLRLPLNISEYKILRIDIKHQFKYLGNTILVDQVLNNLISNAIYQIKKYNQGNIYITTMEDERYNLVKIIDTAGNVTAETINKIFKERFTTKVDGHGIGMQFCYQAMQLLSGDIQANLVNMDNIEFVLFFPKICIKEGC